MWITFGNSNSHEILSHIFSKKWKKKKKEKTENVIYYSFWQSSSAILLDIFRLIFLQLCLYKAFALYLRLV